MNKLGLYIHIPFCKKKCLYCDFLSFENLDKETPYMEALISEIKNMGNKYLDSYQVDSVFIGGGTPSIINEALIAALLTAVKANFNVTLDAEITIETNPGTLNQEKLKTYINAGINRISMGVQSLDINCLNLLGRIHNEEEFYESYKLARKVGFKNINVDLMFSIPEQTRKTWINTLEKIIKLEPEHISFYSLQIEEETPYFNMFKDGILSQSTDQVDRKMYHDAIKIMKNNGYNHYEISNAAKENFSCKHNLKYWSFEPYLGLGLGSHSFMEGKRFSNTKDLSEYIEKISKSESTIEWIHENTQKDNISEYIFTGLRKTQGIDLLDFEKRFGIKIEKAYEDNWLEINEYIKSKCLFKSENKLKITEKGIDISNKILAEFV